MLVLLSCLALAGGSKVLELTAANFGQDFGKFEQHPVRGHTQAMVLFYDANTSDVMLSEFQAVAQAVGARGLADKVMIAQLKGDAEENKAMGRFGLKRFPFVAMLTEGKQAWSVRRASRAPVLLTGLTKILKLEPELALAPVSFEKGVIELQGNHFRGNAGEFASHPVKGHKFALVMCHDANSSPGLFSEYEAVARTLAHFDAASKVMVARMDVDVEANKVMKERFELDQLPFILWLTQGEEDWSAMSMRSTEDLVAQIHEKVDIGLRPAREEL